MYHIHALGVIPCYPSLFSELLFLPLCGRTQAMRNDNSQNMTEKMKPEKGVELLECLRSFQRLHEGP